MNYKCVNAVGLPSADSLELCVEYSLDYTPCENIVNYNFLSMNCQCVTNKNCDSEYSVAIGDAIYIFESTSNKRFLCLLSP
jgi:hypothetical protein